MIYLDLFTICFPVSSHSSSLFPFAPVYILVYSTEDSIDVFLTYENKIFIFRLGEGTDIESILKNYSSVVPCFEIEMDKILVKLR